MDSDWTASAKPAEIIPHAPTTHRPFIIVCGPGANLNVTEALSGHDIDEGGPLEAMVQRLIMEEATGCVFCI